MTAPNGGPAFPLATARYENGLGMTLRDYFAAKAMAACPLSNADDMAAWCYKRADAMLAAREKGGAA